MSVKNNIFLAALRKAYDYLDKDPVNRLPKMGEYMDRFIPEDSPISSQITAIKGVLRDPDNNWYRLMLDIFTNIDPEVRRTVFENFVINASVRYWQTHEKTAEQYSCNIPWAILMDPTSACNLHCVGCWAAEYGNKLNLTYEELDSIVTQANELGTYFFLFSGGEPLVRKKDIIRLCEAHPDSQFSCFTNGTLIDEAFADEMLRVKNFIPAISVEGFGEATDARRGQGTFAHVERAMKVLREKKLPFGVSCCYTSQNVEVIGSEAYFDWMTEQGAKFCWLFTYIPVGKEAVPELMVTAKQRKFMYEQVRKFRCTKPIFTLDFWNDGEYSQGCIAGGRVYLHINANGDYEPCAFIHYSDTNVRTHTLVEALQAPLFTAYKNGQPWNENHLRPCPLLDNPQRLVEAVEASGAKSTDLESPENVHDLTGKCEEPAKKWSVVADELWARTHKEEYDK